MRYLAAFLFFLFSCYSYAQKSNVEFDGEKKLILSAQKGSIQGKGTLSTGEPITSGCDHGSCFIRIEYKGRTIQKAIGDDITNLSVYEYDFGHDGDKEIVVVNEFMNTTYLKVFSYGRGMIEKLFEKEVSYYRTVLKSEHIEYYLPSGLEGVWNYYQGKFWAMSRLKLDDY